MISLATFMIVICLVTAVLLFIANAVMGRKEREKLNKLRVSPLYARFYGSLKSLSKFDIDQILIEGTGITVTGVSPSCTLLKFSFKLCGHCKRNPRVPGMFAELIAMDFPQYTLQRCYKIRRTRVYRLNGRPEYAYSFTIRRAYKDYLLSEQNARQYQLLY